jgi:hypothetical protein
MTLTIICCVCGKVKNDDGEWVERETTDPTKKVSHTYCPECFDKESKHIAEITKNDMRLHP